MSNPREELKRRRTAVEGMGGQKRIERQHQMGKWTARERLAYLLDEGTFEEIGAHVKHRGTLFGMAGAAAPADGVVTGYGRIFGRPVYVFAQDFTVLGGSLGEMHAAKIQRVQDLALKSGVPIIGLNDSGGARIQEGVDALNGYGEIFKRNTWASGVIPQITVIMGPSAGGAVYSPALTDIIIMVRKTAQMFITGPQVIQAVTGETVTSEALGGADTHLKRSGVAHLAADSDQEALDMVRRVLSFLPQNFREEPPVAPTEDPLGRLDGRLADVIPLDANKPYDVTTIIRSVLDDGDFFELQKGYADNLVIGLGRIGGRPVGIVANQPRVLAGTLDINASDKLARFVRFCDAFNIPVVTLVDTPGYLPGTAQEYGGIIRHGAKVLYAYAEATVPKVTLILRKAYGGAYLATCSRSLGADLVLAWPTAEIAVMGPDGAANIIFRRDIEASADPQATKAAKAEEYREEFANPYVAASRGYIDAVIDPVETRGHVARALMVLYNKHDERPAKHHGNMPV
ncbi:acyl-CoA carboxylase subunit beta [Sulfobacillus harzensis]|uniref:Methylmalonyl-CoA carboxyltransferase n=1 Tax=Sulfobacillus harzensis TaxID=2729629 RepID=A0A7Y0L3D9_9FIRM|nr:carboxyl transferase domain-containing protein [Sulfobacillus harzensis]NMP22348.1 methylmalonyl-CoA carboxyltransferase [Sulfobacillus harzensis]